MADKGWIKTYRQILDCWLWTDKEPYDKRSAWMYLLLTANHSDKKIMFNGEFIVVKRGQILTSIRTLAEKWKWSYDKTLRFLRLIESDGMIEKESDKFRTLVTIVNYEVFQDCPNTDRTETSEQTSERVSDKQECKELKNINKPPLSPLEGETEEPQKRVTLVSLVKEHGFNKPVEDIVIEWCKYKSEKRQSYKPTGFKRLLSEIQNNIDRYGEESVIDIISKSMASNWQGIAFDKLKTERSTSTTKDAKGFDWDKFNKKMEGK